MYVRKMAPCSVFFFQKSVCRRLRRANANRFSFATGVPGSHWISSGRSRAGLEGATWDSVRFQPSQKETQRQADAFLSYVEALTSL